MWLLLRWESQDNTGASRRIAGKFNHTREAAGSLVHYPYAEMLIPFLDMRQAYAVVFDTDNHHVIRVLFAADTNTTRICMFNGIEGGFSGELQNVNMLVRRQ